MTRRELESNGLYRQTEPFQLLLLPHIEGRKRQNGGIEIDVFPEKGELMRYSISNGYATGNPLLELFFQGKNPYAHYLKERYEHLITKALPEEIVLLATPNNPIRWNGAGGVMILREEKSGKRYLPLNIRSGSSGFYDGKIDGNGGLSGSLADWLAPNLLGYREVLEEILILKGNKRILPVNFQDYSFDENMKLRKRIMTDELLHQQTNTLRQIFPDIEKYAQVNYPIRRIPQKQPDKINVHYRGQIIGSEGIVNVDPAISSIDLRQIYEVPVDTIDDVVIIDGEDENAHKRKAKDRIILLFEVDELLKLIKEGITEITPFKTFKSGKTLENRSVTFTLGGDPKDNTVAPALARLLSALDEIEK